MRAHIQDRTDRLPQSPSCPDLIARSVELFTGSIRHDAMRAIRTSRLSDWKFEEVVDRSLNLESDTCRVKLSFSQTGEPQSLSMWTSDDFLLLRGDCESAQRLGRYICRQLGLLVSREKK
jgi:hypothetical protein